ncbi:VWA domain-containing protein [Tsukamurella sp. NPDC003166]|uniref:VWA domain-containing protein n=1 Tax=Tsukamurella sp. NPDC003166 TaxID=3154444 RepID=UPI0033AF1B47
MRRLALLVVALLLIVAAPAVLPPRTASAPVAAAPDTSAVLIVLDLSSSMNSDDGTGITKLDGAKRSLVNLVNKMQRGSRLGLWTYPGKSDSCSAGGYEPNAEVKPVQNPYDMGLTISGLSANGDTPTGDALKAAAASVKGNEKNTTIMLVSDGESNCNNDPCAVAKDLAAQGLMLTINTVGFRISDQGKKELECIAGATNGKYMSVDDSQQLGKVLSAAAVPALELTTTVPDTAPTGGTVDLSATVKNVSDKPVSGVQVGLQFRLTGDPAAVAPAVIPPRFDLGTLAPGESLTRKWTVQTTPAGKPGNLNWSIGAWGDTTVPLRKSGTIRSTDERLTGSGPILEMIMNSKHKAVVMGDSYSSGEGGGDYLGRDADHADMCHRSPHTYAAQLLGSADRVNILACSGAVIDDMRDPQIERYPIGSAARTGRGQLNMLDAAAAPSAVFLTLGGNDIKFADIAKACILNVAVDTDCSAGTGPNSLPTTVNNGLKTIEGLNVIYRDVFARANTQAKRAARGGAIAPVIVLPYVMLLPETVRAKSCANLNANEIRFLNDVEERLNAKVRYEVEQARADTANPAEVYFASEVADAFRPVGTMCDTAGNVVTAAVLEGAVSNAGDAVATGLLGWGATKSGFAQELAHPTKAGYGSIAEGLRKWSRHAQRTTVNGVAAPSVGLSTASAVPDLRIDLGTRTRQGVDAAGKAIGDGVADLGRTVQSKAGDLIEMVGKLPSSKQVSVLPEAVGQLHSTPRIVGTTVVDPEGAFTLRVRIPADLPAGRHVLEVFTFGDGEPATGWRIPIVVRSPLPWWLSAAGGVAGAALLGSAVLFWRARRLREAR